MKQPNSDNISNAHLQVMNYGQDTKITALYLRLSKEEQQKSESISIENQKKILLKFCKDNGFQNPKCFIDDGETGVFFDRPGLNEMLAEIRAGNVSTVIIKDQSRIGREVIEIGLLKRTFDQFNVRFMSAEDGLDTAKGFDIMTLLRDVFNEWFVADCSKKIRAVQRAKGKAGEPLSSYTPYGYKKDPENPKRWIIDEPAAKVVRQIFQWCMEGMGVTHIARKLKAQKIEKPLVYAQNAGIFKSTKVSVDPYGWNDTTVGRILEKREYLGYLINFKTYTKSYKNRKTLMNAPNEYSVFENAHDPIIEEEVFERVQKIRMGKRRPTKSGRVSILSGLVFCAECKSKMHLSCGASLKPEQDFFACPGFRTKKTDCTSSHYIRRTILEEVVLTHIQKVAEYVVNYEEDFVLKLQSQSKEKLQKELTADKKMLLQTENRIQELDVIIQRLYEDNISGKLSDERFVKMSQSYENEQKELIIKTETLRTQIASQEETQVNVEQFLTTIRRYTQPTELTIFMLNQLIERVEVHSRAKRHRVDTTQKIDVYFNYAGKIEIPLEVLAKSPNCIIAEFALAQNVEISQAKSELAEKD